jgi:hypothetical protein
MPSYPLSYLADDREHYLSELAQSAERARVDASAEREGAAADRLEAWTGAATVVDAFADGLRIVGRRSALLNPCRRIAA